MSERKIRKLHETGHRRKFLVVVDETPECESAVYFSACRAKRTDSDLEMLYVSEASEFQHWLTVGEIQRQESEHKAAAVFRLYQRKLNGWGFEDIATREVIRHGDPAEQIVALINEDEDISFLVLGASTSADGPGRLVSQLAGRESGSFPIPIVTIPGSLGLHELEALA